MLSSSNICILRELFSGTSNRPSCKTMSLTNIVARRAMISCVAKTVSGNNNNRFLYRESPQLDKNNNLVYVIK